MSRNVITLIGATICKWKDEVSEVNVRRNKGPCHEESFRIWILTKNFYYKRS